MSNDPMFGWDLTFRTVEKDIKRKSDVLVAFIHWNLMKRGFRSIGVGDEVKISFVIYYLIKLSLTDMSILGKRSLSKILFLFMYLLFIVTGKHTLS